MIIYPYLVINITILQKIITLFYLYHYCSTIIIYSKICCVIMVIYEDIVYIFLLTLLASIIGTLAGFGISTIMVPVLLIVLPLPQTLLLEQQP
jgi:hypothetical protein